MINLLKKVELLDNRTFLYINYNLKSALADILNASWASNYGSSWYGDSLVPSPPDIFTFDIR